LIDPLTLKTLPERHFNNGMAEMIKYGMIYSQEFFFKIQNEDVKSNLEYFIYQSLLIKKHFVEADEFDQSVRQILNFGHTFGHAYEAYYNYDKYLHGEAISLGMLKVCDNISVKTKLKKVLLKYKLPIQDDVSDELLLPFIKIDKKKKKDSLNLIIVDEIGKANIKKISLMGGK
jgi:3-dehydroquinate synthase